MASYPLDDEIERLTQDIQALNDEISAVSRRSKPIYRPEHSLSPCASPPSLKPFDSSAQPATSGLHPPHYNAPRRNKRKEIEPRRYSGKESVSEYLTQFELIAMRNGWDDNEMATSLLCALDGSARSLLSELDDASNTSYIEIRELLVKRFGPVRHTEVHEQALQEIRLGRGQPIRELTPEILRLCKLAYPDFDANSRNRLAVRALINAISDRDAVFYIKDKSPTTLDDVCSLYERYRVLTGNTSSKMAVKGIKSQEEETKGKQNNDSHLLASLQQQYEIANRQLQQLTASVNLLLDNQRPPPLPTPPSTLSATAPAFQPSATTPAFQQPINYGQAPKKPCPRCNQPGHWAKHCPQSAPTQQFGGYQQRPSHYNGPNAAFPLNMNGPVSAPDARSNPIRPTH